MCRSDQRYVDLRVFALALGVAAVAWLLYAPALTADFVYDARAKVVISPFIHNPANLPDVLTGRVITLDVLDNNRPGNLLSLMIDSMIWGKRPCGYHLTSITLHAAVCAMLFILLVRMLPGGLPGGMAGSIWPAGLAALAFAVHPLNCEAVCEVSYREDLLVAASILVALFAAMAFLQKPGGWRNFLWGAVCCMALLFGVSAKENGVAGPVVIVCYWYLWRRDERPLPWAGLLAAACLVVGGFLAARFTMRPEHSIIFRHPPERLGGTLVNSFLIQLRIWAMQFCQTGWPRNLCADYTGWSIRDYPLQKSAVIVGVVAAAQIFLATRNRLFALGLVFFWAGLLPVSNLVPLFRPMADRFMYVPLLGLAIILARGLFLAGHLPPLARRAIFAGVALSLCAGAAVTFKREAVWHDSPALWRNTATDNPFSFTAADNFGWVQLDAHQYQEAAASFERAIRLTKGGDADSWSGLALAREGAGQPAEADAAFGRAVALDARYAHPQELVRALTLEEDGAGKLEVLARRNTKP